MWEQPVVFVNKLIFLEEGLKVLKFFVIFDIETES